MSLNEVSSLSVELRECIEEIRRVDMHIERVELRIARNERTISDLGSSGMDRQARSENLKVLNSTLNSLESTLSNLTQRKNKLDQEKTRICSELRVVDIPVPPVSPDSERVGDLLRTQGSGLPLPFVDRDDATDALVKVHHLNWIERQPDVWGGQGDIMALMDCPFGMGKTSFSKNYLPLVALNRDRYSKYHSAFMDELMSARTLFVTFSNSCLAHGIPPRLSAKFASLLYDSVSEQWGVECPPLDEIDPLGKALRWISNVSNSFIVLDEIGAAFSRDMASVEDDDDLVELLCVERARFLSFVAFACKRMLQTRGMYFLLAGRAPFLSCVGLRPDGSSRPIAFPASPVRFERIHLNPIREEHISFIFSNTMVDENRTLEDAIRTNAKIDGKPITVSEYASILFRITGGHPRTLQDVLSQPCYDLGEWVRRYSEKISQVLLTVGQYRRQVRILYEYSYLNQYLDISSMFMINGKQTSFQYIANGIFACYGENLKRSLIQISPEINMVLDECFMPLSDFLSAYTSGRLLIDKSRVFEVCLVKWFFSTLENSFRDWGTIMDEFLPKKSLLFYLKSKLDQDRFEDGQKVMKQKLSDARTDKGISRSEFAQVVWEYLENHRIHIYLPAPQSMSPDIFILPPGDEKIVIGVAAKCYWSTPTLSLDAVTDEVNKLIDIVNTHEPLRTEARIVLMVCATCPVKVRGFSSKTRSVLWKCKSHPKCEVVIVNLSTSEMRRKFFGLSIKRGQLSRANADTIEGIIREDGGMTRENKIQRTV